jgi:hypothetical protein
MTSAGPEASDHADRRCPTSCDLPTRGRKSIPGHRGEGPCLDYDPDYEAIDGDPTGVPCFPAMTYI